MIDAKLTYKGDVRMPKRVSKKDILTGCLMSFEGISNRQIGKTLGYTETTVSNWRKTEMWTEFEIELVKAYKEEVLSNPKLILENATPS